MMKNIVLHLAGQLYMVTVAFYLELQEHLNWIQKDLIFVFIIVYGFVVATLPRLQAFSYLAGLFNF